MKSSGSCLFYLLLQRIRDFVWWASTHCSVLDEEDINTNVSSMSSDSAFYSLAGVSNLQPRTGVVKPNTKLWTCLKHWAFVWFVCPLWFDFTWASYMTVWCRSIRRLDRNARVFFAEWLLLVSLWLISLGDVCLLSIYFIEGHVCTRPFLQWPETQHSTKKTKLLLWSLYFKRQIHA